MLVLSLCGQCFQYNLQYKMYNCKITLNEGIPQVLFTLISYFLVSTAGLIVGVLRTAIRWRVLLMARVISNELGTLQVKPRSICTMRHSIFLVIFSFYISRRLSSVCILSYWHHVVAGRLALGHGSPARHSVCLLFLLLCPRQLLVSQRQPVSPTNAFILVLLQRLVQLISMPQYLVLRKRVWKLQIWHNKL